MGKMNLKKVTPEIREYVRTRILYLKEKNYSVKDIGNFLNIHDDYVYQVLKKYRENGNSLPTEKLRERQEKEEDCRKRHLLTSKRQSKNIRPIISNCPTRFGVVRHFKN